MPTDLTNFRFVDLFAGIGGFHQAMTHFGANCVFASEWDRHAAHTYFDNYRLKPDGDITKVHEKDIPMHDILCGGFPCQAFSISGKQKGFQDTRGTLFFDIARIIKHHQPKLVFLENVRNFARHDDGKTLKTVVETLERLNYQVHYKVLNASHYGLPQNRERIFFVCFRKDLEINDFSFPKPLTKKTSLNEILETHPKDAKVIIRNDITMNKNRNLGADSSLPNKPVQIGFVNKGGQGERIYSPHGHAITLSAYGGGIGAKTGIYQIGGVLRKLSPRECARLQGFPENFRITSSNAQAYKQFGNSVAINVVKEIIREALKVLK